MPTFTTSMTTVPIGTAADTATPVDLPLHENNLGVPTVIAGASGTGKSHLLEVMARRAPGWCLPVTDPDMLDGDADVLLLDEADLRFHEAPRWWESFLIRARQDGIAVVAAVPSLALAVFGGSEVLRNLMVGGNVLRFWTPVTGNDPDVRVDPTTLFCQGHGYVQTVDADEPVAFWLPQYRHTVSRWGALTGAFRRAPRALCGQSLEADPHLPDPGPDALDCSACLVRRGTV